LPHSWLRVAIVLIPCCLLIPRGVELQFGTAMVDTSRVLLLLFGVAALSRWCSGTTSLRVTLSDVLMAIHLGCRALSAVYHDGLGKGVENGIAVILDMGCAYFVARIVICNVGSYRYYVRVLLLIAAACGILGLSEMVTGYSVVRAAYHAVFPKVSEVYLSSQRLGFYRATATLRADILLGLFCMMAFALAVSVGAKKLRMSRRTFWYSAVLSVVGVFSSLSSGPWTGLAVVVSLLAYDRIFRRHASRWKLLLTFLAGGWLLLTMFCKRSVSALIIDYLCFNDMSGYVRIAMYEAVWAMVPTHWPVGWGWGNDWPRPDWYNWASMDCFYVVNFVQSGAICVVALIAFFLVSWHSVGKTARWDALTASDARSWIVATVVLAVCVIAVHIFGNLVFAVYFTWGAGQVFAPGSHRNASASRDWPAAAGAVRAGSQPGRADPHLVV